MKKKQLRKEKITNESTKEVPHLNKENTKKSYFNLLGLMIIILLGIIIYSNSFSCSFHYDDFKNFVENKNLPDLMDFKAWWNFSQTRLVSFYSFALNIHFNQFDVWGYHLLNLIIHLITACLVWWLTFLIFSSPAIKDHPITKYRNELAIITALLFVSHPLATQSVTYIVQRMASMVAMFYLLSIALYLKARLVHNTSLSKYLLYAGSILAAVLAMLTKENAFTLPFAVILVEFFFIRTKSIVINFKNYRVILLVAGFIGFILLIILKFSFNIFKPLPPTPFHSYSLSVSNYFLTQLSVILKYIQLLFLPINQMLDYDFLVSNSFFEVRTLISFLFILLLIILAIFQFNKNRIFSFGIFWFLLTLSIESSLIPIYDVIFEHRIYLPSFGFFIILSSSIYLLLREKIKYLAIGILAVIVISNSYLTYERNKVWKNDLSLWSDNVKKAPNLVRPNFNRGVTYEKLKQWDKAIADYSRVITINPYYANAYFNRGQVYGTLKQWDKAISDYSKAIEVAPDYAVAFSNRGAAYVSMQVWDKAIADYTKAIELDPNYSTAYYNRGIAYGNLSNWTNAIADYSKAITANPNFSDAFYNRGIAFKNLNDWDNAIADYTSAIGIRPDFADAYCNRGIIYGTIKEWGNAIADYSKAIGIVPNHAKAHFNRGIAYANLQQWDSAILDYSSAITINPNYTNAYYNRGIAFGNIKKWEKALEDYNSALNIDPNFTLAYTSREIAFRNFKVNKSK